MSLCLNKSYLWQNINQKHHIMITFPNAKINLGLNVVEKRADGYHNIETVFYPINLQDALEVNRLENRSEPFRLYVKGTLLDGAPEDNLVVKAYLLLREKYQLPPVDIHLYKHIPTGAGLGGGSADGAFMIKLLNEKFQIGLTVQEMEEYAARIGADCARKYLRTCHLHTCRLSAGIGQTAKRNLDQRSL